MMAKYQRFVALSPLALLLASCAAIVPGPATHRAAVSGEGIAPREFPATQALFDEAVSSGRVVGITGAFGVEAEPTRYVSAGRIALEPSAQAAAPDTLWRGYSMTKPITGIAAMILVEDGKLRLDQPVSDFFPAFKSMKVLVDPDKSLEANAATEQITIRHLLTHTSGLTYAFGETRPIDKEYLRLGLIPSAYETQREAVARAVRPATLQEFADRVAQAPLLYQPGKKWSYGIGLDVLGAVIERASGLPFDRFLQERVFAPLKMNSTVFTVPESEVGRFATNFTTTDGARAVIDPGRGSVFLQPPTFPYGGSGLVTTARDIDRFLKMLQNEGELDGVRILGSETARLAMSDLLPPGVIFTYTDTGVRTGGPMSFRAGFGAGGMVFLEDIPGKAKAGTFGWGGAAGTISLVNPVQNYRMTMMVNETPPIGAPQYLELGAAVLRDAGFN